MNSRKDTLMHKYTTRLMDEQPVGALDILLLIRSYNRKEINYGEWLRLSRTWAEAVVR
jgi:hypothetical protein